MNTQEVVERDKSTELTVEEQVVVPESGARCAGCGEPCDKPERHVRMELQAWLENDDATEEQRDLGNYEDWNTQILFDSEWDSDLSFCNEDCEDTWAREFQDEYGDSNVDPRSLFTEAAKLEAEVTRECRECHEQFEVRVPGYTGRFEDDALCLPCIEHNEGHRRGYVQAMSIFREAIGMEKLIAIMDSAAYYEALPKGRKLDPGA